jgi:hypothetical protein
LYEAKTIDNGTQELSKFVYFLNDKNETIRPIYQKDENTTQRSYRVYIKGGNTKDVDEDVHCYKQLAKLLIDGHTVRCRLPDGKSSNRSVNSKNIAKLVVEVTNT